MSYYPDEAYLDMVFNKMEDALLYLPFDEDANDKSDSEDVPSTESGGIIHPVHITPQVGAGCVQLGEATTNLWTNPSGEVNTTGVTAWNVTLSVSEDQAFVGSKSFKMIATATECGIYSTVATGAPLAKSDYSMQAEVFADASTIGVTARIDIIESGGAQADNVFATKEVLLVAGWNTFVCAGTMAESDRTSVYGQVILNDATVTDVAYVDGVQVENRSFPTPLCIGDMGAGHSWAGTEHESTSSKTITELDYDNPFSSAPSVLTISTWVRFIDVDLNTGLPYIFHFGDQTTGRIFILEDDNDSWTQKAVVAGFVKDSESLFVAESTNLVSDLTWHHICLVCTDLDTSAPKLQIYLDGVTGGSVTADYALSGLATDGITFGSWTSAGFEMNGWMDETILIEAELTAAEVENLYYEGLDGRAFDGVWTPVLEDVLTAGDVNWRGGIFGMMPTDRSAGSGTVDFHLNNSEKNSAGLLGYYSVGHTNAREGFGLGVKVRIWFEEGGERYYKFIGKLIKATPTPGAKKNRVVQCSAVDWLGSASLHKVNLMSVEQDIRSDEAFQKVVENLATQPEAVSYGVGQETFAFWGDDLKDEKTTGLAALDRVCMSEFGYTFIRGGAIPGELVFQNRHERVKDTAIEKTFAESDLSDMRVRREEGDIRNRVEAVVFPREISENDENLYSLQTPLLINAGQKKTILARYKDPDNRDVRLSALELNDPEGLNEIKELVGGDSNRDFEGGIGDWVADSYPADGDETEEQSDEYAFVGTYSGKMTTGTDSAVVYGLNLSDAIQGVAQDDVIYFQGYVYFPAEWPQDLSLIIQEQEADDTFIANYTIDTMGATQTGEWVRLSGIHTVVDVDCDHILVSFGNTTNGDFSGGAVTVYVDEVYVINAALLNFEFSESDVGGGNKNNDLVLYESYLGGNMAQLVVENISEVDGYITILKVRGKVVRTYDPVMQFAESEESIDDHFKRTQHLQLKYQDDPLVGQDWADKVLGERELPETILESFTVNAARSSGNLAAVLELEPGDRIDVAESVAAIDDEYFINGIEYRMQATDKGVALMAMYFVVIAGTEAYWLVGEVGSSELGETTWLGF